MVARKTSAAAATIKKAAGARAIPLIPFSYEEVSELTIGTASNELQQRFVIWKASEYQTIKQIEDAIQNNNSAKLSKQLRVLREQYFDWLVSIESDKFRALESVGVQVGLAKSSSGSSESNRDENLDDFSEETSQEDQQEQEQQQVERVAEIYQ